MKKRNLKKRGKKGVTKNTKCNNSNKSKVVITGIVNSNFEFYEKNAFGDFYKIKVKTKNIKGIDDIIPVVISDVFITDINEQIKNKFIEVKGKYRSFTKEDEEGIGRLEVFVLASEVKFYADNAQIEPSKFFRNLICFDGYLCKDANIRFTPSGKIISDLVIAVNRNDGTGDYIRCIAWERTAKRLTKFNVGDHLCVYGQIRSRKYQKRDPNGIVTLEREINEVVIQFVDEYLKLR